MSCGDGAENIPNEKKFLRTDEITARDDGDPCFSSEFVTISDCGSFSKSINAEFDEYPGCTFEIRFGFIECSDILSGGKTFYLENLELVSHDCDAYNNDVLQAQQDGTLKEFSLRFDKMLYDAASFNLGQAAHSFEAVVVKYNTASCIQYCYILGSKKGYTYHTFLRTRCGEGCCAIETTFAVEDDELIFFTANITEDVGLDDCNVNIVACHPNAVYTTECTFRCDSFI